MYEFVIVEDNEHQMGIIKKTIISFMMSNKYEFNIVEFVDYSKELLKVIDNKNDNRIYILDLELPSGEGVDIARYIRDDREDWISPIIIFTAHTSLATQLYKERLNIVDFIGKCDNSEANLLIAFEIALKILGCDKSYKYTYNNIDYVIALNDINYIIKNDRRSEIVTKVKTYYQNISICNIKELLPSYFVIASKGVLVNKRNIKEVDWNNNTIYFMDGTTKPLLSKKHKKDFAS